MKLSLGSHNKNDIVIKEQGVEDVHAEIEIIDSNTLLISNKSVSSNIYIDGAPILKARIRRKNTLLIGEYSPTMDGFFNNIFKIYKQSKVDFSEEFTNLLKDFALYQKKKDAINKTPLAPLIAKAFVTVIIVAFIYIYSDIYNLDVGLKTVLISAGGALSVILGSIFSPSNKTINEKLDHLLLEYEQILVCPKCGVKMINHNYTYWKGKKKCINNKCDAIYQY